MNKQIISGLLMAAALTPAAAAPLFSRQSPEDPIHRRTIALCMLLGVGLRAYKRGTLPSTDAGLMPADTPVPGIRQQPPATL